MLLRRHHRPSAEFYLITRGFQGVHDQFWRRASGSKCCPANCKYIFSRTVLRKVGPNSFSDTFVFIKEVTMPCRTFSESPHQYRRAIGVRSQRWIQNDAYSCPLLFPTLSLGLTVHISTIMRGEKVICIAEQLLVYLLLESSSYCHHRVALNLSYIIVLAKEEAADCNLCGTKHICYRWSLQKR